MLTLLAVMELIIDQLASKPSRKVPMQFGARIIMGGVSGAAVGVADGNLVGGLVAGVIGTIIGTLVGALQRRHLAEDQGER